ncbi:MAG: ATP-dependent zinc metalloprotease FtsH [Bacteroidaceae bacterium]
MDTKENKIPEKDKKESKIPLKFKGLKGFKFNLSWIYLIIIAGFLGVYMANGDSSTSRKFSYDKFQSFVNQDYIKQVTGYDDNTVEAIVKPENVTNVFKEDSAKVGQIAVITTEAPTREQLSNLLDQAHKDGNFNGVVVYEKKSTLFSNILSWIFPLGLMFFLYFMFMRSSSSAGGGLNGGLFNVGKSKAKLYDKNTKVNITFKDVAGLAEAKQEVEEIVEFLRQPQKFTTLGGKIPKGALLVGPPGTGKTLLAKAVAGEADVPFFSLAGSDFVEMFVGVGASRVRDLFKQAQEKAPCIIFIDEIDAIGRARSKGPQMGGTDERENTLNQLLTEMDGFGTNSGVIILAATNRAEVLDKALLRAGRFDRQITVDLPDLNERKEVFLVHLKPLKLSKDLDLDTLSRQTPGFSGADIANVCNEAALIAARHNKKEVDNEDFHNAVDRIVGGLEKKTRISTKDERRSIAIHEAGHATLSWVLEYANPLVKVTIVPRGRTLGAAWYLPEERQITTKEQLLDEMCSLLGGRAAEELFTGHISSGAMNDLERVTKQAYSMIALMGMSDSLPNICYYQEENYVKPYSQKTAELIDIEIHKLIAEQYARAKRILTEFADKHNQLAEVLIRDEVIYTKTVETIFGKRQWKSRSEEVMEYELDRIEKNKAKLLADKEIADQEVANDKKVDSQTTDSKATNEEDVKKEIPDTTKSEKTDLTKE